MSAGNNIKNKNITTRGIKVLVSDVTNMCWVIVIIHIMLGS